MEQEKYNLEKEKYVAYFDGACKPNPGHMKIGFLIKDFNGNVIDKCSKNMGFGTNNQSEYSSMLELVKRIVELKIKDIKIMGDSQLVVNQINGSWKCSNSILSSLKQQVHKFLNKIPKWELKWVKREKNTEADSLSH